MTQLHWNQPADMPLGVATLAKLAFDGVDLGPLRSQLLDKYVYEPSNAAALMDLSIVEQLLGNEQDGLQRQYEALALRRSYRSPGCAMPSLRLLALAAPGDVGNNTPLEFLIESSDVALTTLYIAPGEGMPPALPEHDLAIVTACESDANRPALDEIARLIPSWPKPVLNHPDRIAWLAREKLPELAGSIPGLVAPKTVRIDRAALADIAAGRATLASHLPGGAFPVIARPLGSHAGRGLMKLADTAALSAYLADRPEPAFHIARYIDYVGSDGLYRKYRIAFISGRPYPCHLAIAEQWMIYYLNAGMRESAAKKAEEELFLTRFEEGFGRRHGAALDALAARIGLDYFGIDCAETASGELLLFEADIAMIVHLMDSPVAFPYKAAPMRKLFAAFCAMLKQRASLALPESLASVA